MIPPKKLREIASILRRNKAVAELGRRCEKPIKSQAVSMWLAGGPNSNIEKVVDKFVAELLEKERLAAGDVNGPSARKVVEEIRSKKASPNE